MAAIMIAKMINRISSGCGRYRVIKKTRVAKTAHAPTTIAIFYRPAFSAARARMILFKRSRSLGDIGSVGGNAGASSRGLYVAASKIRPKVASPTTTATKRVIGSANRFGGP
jgi:hypothetical protein